jgi:hypothetical protein
MMGIVRYIQMQDECGQLGGGNKQIGASADGPEGPEEGIYPWFFPYHWPSTYGEVHVRPQYMW